MNKNKSEPKHIYAEKKIRKAVSRLKIGDKTPGERVFAKEFGISYMTARRAVENLVEKGILYKVAKKGTFVASHEVITEKTKNIGYFLDGSISGGLSSPYYSLIFDALEKAAARNGYTIMYFSDADQSNANKVLEKVDGVIASCFPRIESKLQEIKKHVPVVCIDNSSRDKSIPSLTIDNFNPVIESVNHLYSLGHDRIGFITGLHDSDVGRTRLVGYTSALHSHGLSEDADLIFKGDYSYETGVKGANYFLELDKPPTAIICANDIMAIGAIKEISHRGLIVPGNVSIIGFDDITVASQVIPPLTTIAVPVKEIAELSISMLTSIIEGVELDNTHVSLPGKLVVRRSSAEKNKSTPAAKKMAS